GFVDFSFARACVVTGVLAIFGVLLPNAPGFVGAYQFSLYAGLAIFYPREQVLGEGALFVFLIYLAQILVVVSLAGWAAWFGGMASAPNLASLPAPAAPPARKERRPIP